MDKMKIILIGYPGSQCIVPASRYLTSKYLSGFDIHYLNYIGEKDKWSAFVGEYLTRITDKFIIFALDDYLISDTIDMNVYENLLRRVKNEVVCAKLHRSTMQEHYGYPVTTQYTIWNREFLIWLLQQTTSPWDFEINGSKIFRNSEKTSLWQEQPALEYGTSSCLSSRWRGIRVDGLKQEDIDYIKNNNLII